MSPKLVVGLPSPGAARSTQADCEVRLVGQPAGTVSVNVTAVPTVPVREPKDELALVLPVMVMLSLLTGSPVMAMPNVDGNCAPADVAFPQATRGATVLVNVQVQAAPGRMAAPGMVATFPAEAIGVLPVVALFASTQLVAVA
jgi:hypothetical protein